MKIFIGKYRNWIGPYQIANWLQLVGFSEDRCDVIGKWLADSWVNDACQWIENKKKRKVKIRIDGYDVWSMDSTLAYIILPMLKILKENKHGAPFTDDEDVPEAIRSTAAPAKENEWDTDDFFFRRWEYIMDELIWTFEQLHPDADWEALYSRPNFGLDMEGYEKHQKRITNGLRLFGKYYQGLWD